MVALALGTWIGIGIIPFLGIGYGVGNLSCLRLEKGNRREGVDNLG